MTVPFEATPEMAKAALDLVWEDSETHYDLVCRLWRAMAAAAPDPSYATRELALEEAARYHDKEAEYYSTRHGQLDGVPFMLVAHFHRLHAEAIRALSSPDHADAGKVEGDGWQTIESAPKDGTIVLLGWNDPDIEEIGAVAGWYEGGPADKCWYNQYHEPVTATHWMPIHPLPSAPASEVTKP